MKPKTKSETQPKRKKSGDLTKMQNLLAAFPLLFAACSCMGEEVCNNGQGEIFTLKPGAGEDGPSLELAIDGSKLTFVLTNSIGLAVLSGSLATTIPAIAGPPLTRPDCDAEFCLR